MIPLTVITGPTASGKTQMAIELALKKNGEIVSADSMQIYRRMDVGTAKPSLQERAGVVHHMIDVAEPWEKYSVARYCEATHSIIAEIHQKGKTPILTGGTGLYIDSVVNNIKYGEGEADPALRRELCELADKNGNGHIHEMLKSVDSESAEKIHVSDRKRIVRALEVFHTTGETMTEQKRISRSGGSIYDAKIYAIDVPRQMLYERVNARVDCMIERGLQAEVRGLLESGVSPDANSMQGIGYKEMIGVINGEKSLDRAIEEIKQNTRHYAKRQLTWFRRNPDIIWNRYEYGKE